MAIMADSEDILSEILLRLPIKSLISFKSVSKRWLSLISDHNFLRRYRDFHTGSVSGLFLNQSITKIHGRSIRGRLDYVNLEQSSDPFERPVEPPIDYLYTDVGILQSCNGLLMCSKNVLVNPHVDFVCNPTTSAYAVLPTLLGGDNPAILGLGLAFDPLVSADYKVVCVRMNNLMSDCLYQIEIYSSETCRWSLSGDPFNVDVYVSFRDGVYVNGCVHWLSHGLKTFYFDVREERLRQMPMPRVNDGNCSRYFGESRGHLHLIARRHLCFNVYEMETDCSGWFVKFQVNLGAIPAAFLKILPRGPLGRVNSNYSLLCVVRGQLEEESYLVLEISGAILRYNFCTETCEKICDEFGKMLTADDIKAHQYITTLASV